MKRVAACFFESLLRTGSVQGCQARVSESNKEVLCLALEPSRAEPSGVEPSRAEPSGARAERSPSAASLNSLSCRVYTKANTNKNVFVAFTPPRTRTEYSVRTFSKMFATVRTQRTNISVDTWRSTSLAIVGLLVNRRPSRIIRRQVLHRNGMRDKLE